MHTFAYGFEAKVELLDFGRMAYTVVYLPTAAKRQLPLAQHPRLRIDGEVNGVPFHGAFQPAGKDRFYLILSKRYLKTCRLSLGDRTQVRFDIADQDAVDVPDELRFALQADDAAAAAWARLTPGKQRGFAYRVASAKRPATRENRVEEVLEALRST
ncbi:MAG: YdeI/OmpD-associated family protein [Planctomycetota bacterium]